MYNMSNQRLPNEDRKGQWCRRITRSPQCSSTAGRITNNQYLTSKLGRRKYRGCSSLN